MKITTRSHKNKCQQKQGRYNSKVHECSLFYWLLFIISWIKTIALRTITNLFHLCCSISICCHWCAYTHFIWSPLHISKTSKRILLPTNCAYIPKYISRPFQWQPKSATRLSYTPSPSFLYLIYVVYRTPWNGTYTK